MEYEWLVYLNKEREFSAGILQVISAAIRFDLAPCVPCFGYTRYVSDLQVYM